MCHLFLKVSRYHCRDVLAEDLLVRTFMFLRSARYSFEDISSLCAHASVYFEDIFEERGAYMGPGEAGHTMIVCMFLGHSFCLDNACSSRRWHRKLLADYCPLHIWEEAIMHLMRVRSYRLRIADQDLEKRGAIFLECSRLSY